MKIIILFVSSLFLVASVSFANARTITFSVVKKDGVTVWLPESVDVKPGEEIEIKAEHKDVNVKPEHSFFIPEFKIDTTVKFGETKTLGKFKVPETEGKLKVSCLMHTTHQPAFFVIKK